MVQLRKIEKDLNDLFKISELEQDPAFGRFIPRVYDPIEFDWKSTFEKDFTSRFNGLMIRGNDEVRTVYMAVFPTDQVLESFIDNANEGDLLFMHHPLLMECGDPRGESGRGFVPIKEHYLQEIKEKRLSIHTCHVPMDYHKEIGTNMAIAEALNATVIERFLPYNNTGHVGLICEIPTTNTENLADHLKETFDIPYIDFEGVQQKEIKTVAIVAGCGDSVEDMKDAEVRGAQAYITGEIHCHIDNEYGRKKYKEMMQYVPDTNMSLMGVSHSASEYLVMKTQMSKWFQEQYPQLNIELIPQHRWWL
ncbi:Nif3-like dinuclear metal center hexameric protein [Pseudalkalibacillus berkeleyi]|uniref:GTP cyclohydrolase 1 type 2 homolog n=1 Tax=Pseudalkalibacillus berkeleyi TaxID=1069813 RepID=A0ABS9H0X0_9BACL|nr:Nif3-like dinuclear metal center hexameric protein [Pseudalkalibacillus berkeleyi]MCF6138642.1 Nif3-like dinuclear metal center hexameric protein [Pseudalkalibacillus berkeleyi]